MRFSYFGSPHSSGLGFGQGAALGVSSGAGRQRSSRAGAYVFGEPLSRLFVQRAHQLLVPKTSPNCSSRFTPACWASCGKLLGHGIGGTGVFGQAPAAGGDLITGRGQSS